MSLKDLLPLRSSKQNVPAVHDDDDSPFALLHRDVDRAFANFWRTIETSPLGPRFGMSDFNPRADVVEKGGHYEASIELPGMGETDIEVSVSRGLLMVKGEKKATREHKDSEYFLSERSYGQIQRSLSLPANADVDKAVARFKNGVLTVSLPKTAAVEPETKKITVTPA